MPSIGSLDQSRVQASMADLNPEKSSRSVGFPFRLPLLRDDPLTEELFPELWLA
jgi:hypothetical protein